MIKSTSRAVLKYNPIWLVRMSEHLKVKKKKYNLNDTYIVILKTRYMWNRAFTRIILLYFINSKRQADNTTDSINLRS